MLQFLWVAVAAVFFSVPAARAHGEQHLVSNRQAVGVLSLRNVTTDGGGVSAQIVNKGLLPVENVRLLIRHAWLWKDERNPGTDNPGRAVYHTVAGRIAPGAALPFTYHASPPLPERDDGTFETAVEIVGFTEIGAGSAAGQQPQK